MAETNPIDEVVGESPDALREQALRQIKKRRDFHAHVFVYLAVNIVLWGIWSFIGVTSDSWSPWPVWVTLGWGWGWCSTPGTCMSGVQSRSLRSAGRWSGSSTGAEADGLDELMSSPAHDSEPA